MSTSRKNRWKLPAFAFGFAVLMTCAWLVSLLSVGPSLLSSGAEGFYSVANFGGDFLAGHLQSYLSLDPLLLAGLSWEGGETWRFVDTGWVGYAATELAAAFVQGLAYAALVGVIGRWWARRRTTSTS